MGDQSEPTDCRSDSPNLAQGACQLDEKQLQALLKEYEESSNCVMHWESMAWQMMAAIPVAALAGIFYLWSKLPPNTRGVVGFAVATIAVLLLLYYWYSAQERWRNFTVVHNYRRQRIEKKLKLRANLYVHWLDEVARGKRLPKAAECDKDFDKLRKRFRSTAPEGDRRAAKQKWYPGGGVMSRRWIIRITMVAWLLAFVGFAVMAYLDP